MGSCCYKTVVVQLAFAVHGSTSAVGGCGCQQEWCSSFSCLSRIGSRGRGGWGVAPIVSWLSRQEEHSNLPLWRQ